MDKSKLEKARTTQQLIQDLADRADKLTSGNVSHEIAALRSITINLNDVMITDLIQSCDTEHADLKELLEKVEVNMRAIDNILAQLNASNIENGKKHVHLWYKFYADALDNKLKKYEEVTKEQARDKQATDEQV